MTTESEIKTTDAGKKTRADKTPRRPYLSGTLKSPSGELLGVLALWVVKPKKEEPVEAGGGHE